MKGWWEEYRTPEVGEWVGEEASKQHQWGALKSLFIFLEVSIENPGLVPSCHPFAVEQASWGGDVFCPQICLLGEAGSRVHPESQAPKQPGMLVQSQHLKGSFPCEFYHYCGTVAVLIPSLAKDN